MSLLSFGEKNSLESTSPPTPVGTSRIPSDVIGVSAEELDREVNLHHETASASKILKLTFKNGTTYTLPDVPLTEEQKKQYAALSDTEKAAFHRNRESYLRGLAALMRLGYPIYRVGEPVVNIVSPTAKVLASPIALLQKAISSMVKHSAGKKLQSTLDALEKQNSEPVEGNGLSLPVTKEHSQSERYRRIVQNVLRGIDQELWNRPKVLTAANEGYVVFQAGVGGGAAAGDLTSCKGVFACGAFNIGIAFNGKEKRISIFGISSVDTFNKVNGIYGGGNAFGSLEFGIGNHDVRGRLESEKGVGVTPPGPFLGLFTPSAIQFGFGIGPNIAGYNLPTPSLLTTDVYRFPLFRVSVAASYPYITVQWGKEPIKDMLLLGQKAVVKGARAMQRGCKYIYKKLDGVVL